MKNLVEERRRTRAIFRTFAALVILHAFLPASAGPPLSIDDPGILDPWKLEVITATTLTSTGAGDYYQAPLLDISLGVIQDHLQAAVVYRYVHVNSDGGASEWDFGNLEVGAKWRFLNKDRLQMAFAPYYAFGVSRSAADTGIGDNTDIVVLPVNAECQIDATWRLNGEVLYASVDGGTDAWRYGAAVAYAPSERWEFLFELSGTADRDFDTDFVVARAGFDVALTESVHLLFSMATGLRQPSRDVELDYDLFLGLQFFQ